jgi:hypothetical protein
MYKYKRRKKVQESKTLHPLVKKKGICLMRSSTVVIVILKTLKEMKNDQFLAI